MCTVLGDTGGSVSKGKKNRGRRVIPLNANRRLPAQSQRTRIVGGPRGFRPGDSDESSYERHLRIADEARQRLWGPDYVEPQRPRRRHLSLVEDRRQWHPEGPSRDARSFSRFRSGLTALKYGAISTVAFRDAPKVLACVRRKARKEIMFAKRKAGRVGQKKPRFNWLSKISCKRR